MTDDPRYSVKVKLQRGTGTDDRDTLTATVDADTLDELDDRLTAIRGRLDDLADDLREIQPDDCRRRLADGQATLEGEEAV